MGDESTVGSTSEFPGVSTQTGSANRQDDSRGSIACVACVFVLIGLVLFVAVFTAGLLASDDIPDDEDVARTKGPNAGGKPGSGPGRYVPVPKTDITTDVSMTIPAGQNTYQLTQISTPLPATRAPPGSASRPPPSTATGASPAPPPRPSPSTDVPTRPAPAPGPSSPTAVPTRPAPAPGPSSPTAVPTRPAPAPGPSSPTAVPTRPAPAPRPSSSTAVPTQPAPAPRPSTPASASQTTVLTCTNCVNKAPTDNSLICTVSCRKTIAVPNDGLCDFTLFDSLYATCGGDLGASTLSKSLQEFVALTAASRNTQYGCSIDTLALTDFVDEIKKSRTASWVENNLLNNKIYHWGVMNVHKVYLEGSQGLLKPALEALKEALTFARPLAYRRSIKPYTFLGCYGGCQIIGQEVKSVFAPDAIVILGHMSFQPYAISAEITDYRCVILPPNIYQLPAAVRQLAPYAHTYYDGCKLVECLRTQHQLTLPIGVSVTLKGRFWVPHTDDEMSAPTTIGKYGLFEECDLRSFDQDALPGTVCNMTKSNYTMNVELNQDAQTITTYDKAPGFKQAFAFDNHETFRQKLCDAKYNLTQLAFAVAAYDVNYDSVMLSCQRTKVLGRFVRTVRLRRLGNFLAVNFTDSSKHANCVAL